MGVKTAEFFRALDDSELSVYEVRFLLRVWRRGQCWEKLESIAKSTGMSIGKASTTRRDLVAAGWLTEVITDNHIAYEVVIPNCCSVSPDENKFHVVKPEFHQVKPKFHVVHALPINIQKEDHNTKAPPPDADAQARQAAIDATLALVAFWESLTRRTAPDTSTPDFRDNWFKPFNEIWIMCGRDTEAAKHRVQAVRQELLARRVTLFNPKKLLAHVQAAVEFDLLPMTERMSGNGAGPVDDEKETLWQRTLAALTGGGGIEDDLLTAIKAIGGASRIKMADRFTEKKVKEDLYHAYRLTATA